MTFLLPTLNELLPAAVGLGGLAFLLLTSGWVVGTALRRVRPEPPATDPEGDSPQVRRGTGALIGKCENIIVFVFVLLNQHTAWAILFTAKALVRKEDIRKDSLYFLAGMLVNVTYSLVVAVLVQLILLRFDGLTWFGAR